MTHLRADKVERIADSLAPTELHGEGEGDLLVIGWGGTYGAITSAVQAMQAEGFCGIKSSFETPQSTPQRSGRYYFQIQKSHRS